MFTCIHHLGILSLRVWFVTFIALFMALSRLLGLDFSVLPLWSQLLVFSTNAHDPALFVHVSPHGKTLLLYVDNMISLVMTLSILPLLRLILVISFLCLILIL
jgi:hypothetical protein